MPNLRKIAKPVHQVSQTFFSSRSTVFLPEVRTKKVEVKHELGVVKIPNYKILPEIEAMVEAVVECKMRIGVWKDIRTTLAKEIKLSLDKQKADKAGGFSLYHSDRFRCYRFLDANQKQTYSRLEEQIARYHGSGLTVDGIFINDALDSLNQILDLENDQYHRLFIKACAAVADQIAGPDDENDPNNSPTL